VPVGRYTHQRLVTQKWEATASRKATAFRAHSRLLIPSTEKQKDYRRRHSRLNESTSAKRQLNTTGTVVATENQKA
jgi:hypothetical protein